MEKLTLNALDKLQEELPISLEKSSALSNSKELLVAILEELKILSINELKI